MSTVKRTVVKKDGQYAVRVSGTHTSQPTIKYVDDIRAASLFSPQHEGSIHGVPGVVVSVDVSIEESEVSTGDVDHLVRPDGYCEGCKDTPCSLDSAGPTEVWCWYVGNNDEHYHTECATREEAVYIALNDHEGGFICEALKAPVPLSEFFDVDRFLEEANDRAYDDYMGDGDDTLFDTTAAVAADLEITVRRTIDAWQKDHGLTFMPYLFARQRNEEYIELPDTPVAEN